MRYDPEQKRVIYQPVTIEPREIMPRVIREENYGDSECSESEIGLPEQRTQRYAEDAKVNLKVFFASSADFSVLCVLCVRKFRLGFQTYRSWPKSRTTR